MRLVSVCQRQMPEFAFFCAQGSFDLCNRLPGFYRCGRGNRPNNRTFIGALGGTVLCFFALVHASDYTLLLWNKDRCQDE